MLPGYSANLPFSSDSLWIGNRFSAYFAVASNKIGSIEMSGKSPLKSNPLRNPGESSDRQLQDIVYNKVMPYAGFAAILAVVAVLEWGHWYSNIPPSPWLFTVVAVLALAISFWKVLQALRMAKRIKLGRDGEKAVGQFLERLREAGAQVFHDIPGDGFNLDHVVVHESGLYVVETKTLSKPIRGEAKLLYDGSHISKNGMRPDRNPITQVRAACKWLSDLVHESTGRAFPVRAVVVYPGWYIEASAEAKNSDVWVLNPKALPSFISHSAAQISPEEINLCSYHLSRYIRGTG